MKQGVFAAALLTCLFCAAASALPDDSQQPLYIEAQEVVRDEVRRLTTYEGNVILRQGSILIEADRVIVRHRDTEADRVIAHGNPARMQQRMSADSELVHATARTIQYRRTLSLVELRHRAELRQGDSLLTSERIDYDLDKQIIRATAPQTGQRVKMVIPPGKLEIEKQT